MELVFCCEIFVAILKKDASYLNDMDIRAQISCPMLFVLFYIPLIKTCYIFTHLIKSSHYDFSYFNYLK